MRFPSFACALRQTGIAASSLLAPVSVSQTAPTDTNSNLVRVQLSVAANQATPLAMLTRMVPWQLTANVAMKQELPYVD